jgi:hypothetical protein
VIELVQADAETETGRKGDELCPPIHTSPNVFGHFKQKDVMCYKSFKIHSYKIHGRGKNFVVVMKHLLFVHFKFQPKRENYEYCL